MSLSVVTNSMVQSNCASCSVCGCAVGKYCTSRWIRPYYGHLNIFWRCKVDIQTFLWMSTCHSKSEGFMKCDFARMAGCHSKSRSCHSTKRSQDGNYNFFMQRGPDCALCAVHLKTLVSYGRCPRTFCNGHLIGFVHGIAEIRVQLFFSQCYGVFSGNYKSLIECFLVWKVGPNEFY